MIMIGCFEGPLDEWYILAFSFEQQSQACITYIHVDSSFLVDKN